MIVFAGIGGGDNKLVLASTPVLMLVQMVLLPLYLWLFMGEQLRGTVSAEPFLEAFLVLIALPLALAMATEIWATHRPSGARWSAAMGWVPVPFMGLTLLVVVASQFHEVEGSLGEVARVVPIYVGFLVIIAVLARLAARVFALGAGAGRALVFTAATRNSLVVLPLALGLPAAFAVTPAVIVTQTLVELAGLLLFARLVPRLVPAKPF